MRGSKVMITGRNGYNLEKTVKELSAKGVDVIGFRGDVGIEDDNRKMAEEAAKAGNAPGPAGNRSMVKAKDKQRGFTERGIKSNNKGE